MQKRIHVTVFTSFLAYCLALGWASSSSAQASTVERLEASVNAQIILLSDVQRFKDTLKLRAQLDPLFSGTKIAAAGERAENREIVNFLIDEKLIQSAFPATDSEVEQEINSIQATNHIDRAQLKHALSEQGFVFEQYFELIRISLSKRSLIDRDIRAKISISDDDVKNYFYNHYAKNSRVPMAYKIRVISVTLKNYKSAIGAREVAQSALTSMRSGESFEDVAKRVSDDPNSESGGDLGVVTEDQISPAIREQLKKLKIGQVSEIFGGQQAGAFFILKLEDIRSAEGDRLNKMKEEIRAQLSNEEYQRQITLWIDRQRQGSFVHVAGEATFASLPISK